MTDNGNNDDSTKPKGVDLSKLEASVNFGTPPNADLGHLTATNKAATKFQKQLPVSKALMDSMKSIGDIYSDSSSLSSATRKIVEQGSFDIAGLTGMNKALEELQKQMAPTKDLQDRMKVLGGAYPDNSSLSSVTKIIAEQGSAVSALQKAALGSDLSGALGNAISNSKTHDINPPVFPDIPSPSPSPVIETNQRLESIENQFEKMQRIALRSAEIATGLQASAAEFLGKFEAAANENTQAAKHVKWLSITAIFIAVMMTTVQIAYSELWRGPQEALAARETITELKAEVAAMVESQSLITESLIEALASSDRDTAAALQKVGDILIQLNSAPQEETTTENLLYPR